MVFAGAVDEEHQEQVSAEQVISSFSGLAASKASAINFMKPLWEYNDANTPSCRHRWAKKIDSDTAQYFMITLVLLDIIAVLLKVLV